MNKGIQQTDDMLVNFSEVADMRNDMALAAESILSAMAHMEKVCGVGEPVIGDLDVAIKKVRAARRLPAAGKTKRKRRGRK